MGHKRFGPDRDRLLIAKYAGLTSRLRGKVWSADPDMLAHHRREWPELWKAIDELVEFVDELSPPWPGVEVREGG